jgi:hypothetical protein
MMSTVIAVALGLVPINDDPTFLSASADYSGGIGRYSQSVDRNGATHLRGFDRSGASYDISVAKDGSVRATIGERLVTFRIAERA